MVVSIRLEDLPPTPASSEDGDGECRHDISISQGSSSGASVTHSGPVAAGWIEHIPAMLYKWEVNHQTGKAAFLYVSEYCQELFGVSPEEAQLEPSLLPSTILEEDAPGMEQAVLKSMQELTNLDHSVRIRPVGRSDLRTVHYQSKPRRERRGREGLKQGRAFTRPDYTHSNEMADEVVTVWEGVVTDISNLKPCQPESPPSEMSETTDAVASSGAAVTLVEAERGLAEWLSHEIRNPLSVTMEALKTLQELSTSGVSSQCDYIYADSSHQRAFSRSCSHASIQDGSGNYSAIECHQVMAESMTYVVDLLNNMMDLNQCSQGEMSVNKAPCHVLSDILLPTYRMMKRLRPHHPVELRLTSDLLNASKYLSETSQIDEDGDNSATVPSDIMVNVDKLRLRQVLTNLIANALHYTSKGYVELDLQVHAGLHGFNTSVLDHSAQAVDIDHADTDTARTLAFHVRDTGCGVHPSQYESLFSRWEQLGTSRNGTGIGLCLCQALVRASGGNLRLNAAYHSGIDGQPGAEFIVELPYDIASPLDPQGMQGESEMRNTISNTTRSEPIEKTIASAPEKQLGKKIETSNNEAGKASDLSSITFPLISSELKAHSESVLLQLPGKAEAAPLFLSANNLVGLQSKQMSRQSISLPVGPAQMNADWESRASFSSSCSSAAPLFSSIPKNSYFRGKYRFLIVDDEKMGRKFLKRRLSRLFPQAEIIEVPSGEMALDEVRRANESLPFDMVTMDHFMAVNEMNGAETIRQLRSQLTSDALIVGISGNDKQREHLQAGADAFFQKPLPSDGTLVDALQQHLAPPAGWKVLILSDDTNQASMLKQKLYHVAAPHFISQDQAIKRWDIRSESPSNSGQGIIELLNHESFNLIIMMHGAPEYAIPSKDHCNSLIALRTYLCDLAGKSDSILVDCYPDGHSSASALFTLDEPLEGNINNGKDDTSQSNMDTSRPMKWSLDPLPPISQMRHSLCQALLSVRSATSSPCSPRQLQKRNETADIKSSCGSGGPVPIRRPIRRSKSNTAQTA